MRNKINFFFLLIVFNANCQKSIDFKISIESNNCIQLKPLVIHSVVRNISKDSTIKLANPWSSISSSRLYKPMLQIKKQDEIIWKTIPYSDYFTTGITHCGDGENRGYDDFYPNDSLSSDFVYSNFYCQNLRKAIKNNLFEFVFEPKGTYSIRLLFVNQLEWKDPFARGKLNLYSCNPIYSNEITIKIEKLSKIDKRAIKWLKKHNISIISSIFNPTIIDPLFLDQYYIEDKILEEFIIVFPKSNFTAYAKLRLADGLLFNDKILQTEIGNKKVSDLLNFEPTDNVLRQSQKQIRSRYNNLIEKQKNKDNEKKN